MCFLFHFRLIISLQCLHFLPKFVLSPSSSFLRLFFIPSSSLLSLSFSFFSSLICSLHSLISLSMSKIFLLISVPWFVSREISLCSCAAAVWFKKSSPCTGLVEFDVDLYCVFFHFVFLLFSSHVGLFYCLYSDANLKFSFVALEACFACFLQVLSLPSPCL